MAPLPGASDGESADYQERESGYDCPMNFQRVFSGAPWERRVGYCRALRVGDRIFVTGTASVRENAVHAPGDAYAQAVRCFEIIAEALSELDADLSNVVRTRMFVTDISRWEEFGRAHGESFAEHPPTTSMVEVSALIDPEMLIEIEADAVVGRGASDSVRELPALHEA